MMGFFSRTTDNAVICHHCGKTIPAGERHLYHGFTGWCFHIDCVSKSHHLNWREKVGGFRS